MTEETLLCFFSAFFWIFSLMEEKNQGKDYVAKIIQDC
jgi:hypothetical protein